MKKLMAKIKTLLENHRQLQELAMYLIFGVLTTAVNWAAYLLLTWALGLRQTLPGSTPYLIISNIGQIVGWVLSVLFAFVTNKRYVFRSHSENRKGVWRELGLFVSARVASLLLFDLGLFTVLQLCGMNDKWDKLLMNVLVIVFNYVASRFVIFKKKK
ncbi:MAG: GtrA family protein [Eubacteriales bacterium]|nr:GtrA family protein [Eubacteriales bacterium]